MHNVLRKAALGLLAGAAVMTMTLLAEGSAGAATAAPTRDRPHRRSSITCTSLMALRA